MMEVEVLDVVFVFMRKMSSEGLSEDAFTLVSELVRVLSGGSMQSILEHLVLRVDGKVRLKDGVDVEQVLDIISRS